MSDGLRDSTELNWRAGKQASAEPTVELLMRIDMNIHSDMAGREYWTEFKKRLTEALEAPKVSPLRGRLEMLLSSMMGQVVASHGNVVAVAMIQEWIEILDAALRETPDA